MISLRPLPHSWRVSRYQEELRGDPRWASWTDVSDVGQTFNGMVLTSEEYHRVENSYISTSVRFAALTSASLFRVVYVGHQSGDFDLSAGQLVVRSDVGPIVRGNLRGELDCAIEAVNGRLQIAFGFDLYMYIAADSPCESAVVGAMQEGLWLEPDVPLTLWEDDGA